MCRCQPTQQLVRFRAAWRKASCPINQPSTSCLQHDDHDPDFVDDYPEEDIITTAIEREDWIQTIIDRL